jgi:hypothetical protein
MARSLNQPREDRDNPGAIQRDTEWGRKGCTALSHATTLPKLQELSEGLGTVLQETKQNCEMDFRTVLEPLQWSERIMTTYLVGGWLPFINNESHRLYQALVQNLTSQASRGWDYVKADVQFFAKKLEAFRLSSRHRLVFVLHVYCFLRDQELVGFQTAARMSAHILALHSTLLDFQASHAQLEEQLAPKAAVAGRACPHCFMKGGHTRKDACPFKVFSSAVARKCQVLLRKKLDDGTEMENAVREVLAAPPIG